MVAYVGSKAAIAGRIGATLRRYQRGRKFWEPFCGGLNVTVELSLNGPGTASDIHLPLISLYRAILDGWEPPTEISGREYHDWMRLPDDDPRKGWVGFFDSFGGMWGRTHARRSVSTMRTRSESLKGALYTIESRGVVVEQRSFFDVAPRHDDGLIIYADPPYSDCDRRIYGLGAFDTPAFWERCREWARLGVPVFVSEYEAPDFAEMLWEVKKGVGISKGQRTDAIIERLYKVGS